MSFQKISVGQPIDFDHKVFDISTATYAQTTIVTADTVTELIATDASASYGRWVTIKHAGSTGTVGIVMGGTTLAECFYQLSPTEALVINDWSEEAISVIVDTGNTDIKTWVINYKVK